MSGPAQIIAAHHHFAFFIHIIMARGTVAQHGGSFTALPACRRRSPESPSMKLMLPTMAELTHKNRKDCTASEKNLKSNLPEKTVYKDNWFGHLAIRHLSGSIESITAVKRKEGGYEGLVEAASVITRRHGSKEQQELVVEALNKAFPAAAMATLKALLPSSKFSREFFAIFTTIFFSWLVGPCEVKESDYQGKREKNVVYIPKCRFLDTTNCVGMCTNLCKLPSQKFINDSLGMPTNMIPNFEDKSCEIIFGQHPIADDPALKQPCYRTLCIAKQKHRVGCSS